MQEVINKTFIKLLPVLERLALYDKGELEIDISKLEKLLPCKN